MRYVRFALGNCPQVYLDKYLGQNAHNAPFFKRYMDDTIIVFESDKHDQFRIFQHTLYNCINMTNFLNSLVDTLTLL